MRKIVLVLPLILIPSTARAQIAGQSCPASGQASTNVATSLSFLCTQVGGVLQWVQQPGGGGGGSSFPVTTAVAVNSGGSITVNTGGSIAPAGTGTVTATNATTPLTVSSAGNGNGVLALSGNTSGTATLTAPAVAGTSTNALTMSNVLQGPNGVTGTPTYSFTNDTGTGMWRNGANTLGFSAGGTNIMNLTSSTVQAGPLTVNGNLAFSGGKGNHYNTQAANNDMAGVCSGTTTTCAVTFTTNYTSTPACVLTPTTAGVTSFIITTQANSGFTVTYAPSGTTNFNYVCIGNPN